MADGIGAPGALSARRAFAADWRWLCRLSLVEPAVAVCWHWALVRTFGLPLIASRMWLLFASLWLVYMADRLLDVQRLPEARRPRTERHRFVHDHPRGIAGAWGAVCLTAITAACVTLSLREWVGALFILGTTVGYLWFVHRAGSSRWKLRERGAKELGVALLFASGSTLFVWSSDNFDVSVATLQSLLLALLPFGGLALQNLLHLARSEQHIDVHHACPSVASTLGHSTLLEAGIAAGLLALLAVNLGAIGASVTFGTLHFAQLLPLSAGCALGSLLLLLERRLFPTLGSDAEHVVADVAVLVAALPALVFPWYG